MPRIDFDARATTPELMDDLSSGGEDMGRTLRGLARVNRYLGGLAGSRASVRRFVRSDGPTHILDLGCGLADHAVDLIKWGDRRQHEIHVTGLDANPHIVREARAFADQTLPAALRSRLTLVTGDALDLPFPDNRFSIVLAAMFLHHFEGEPARILLRESRRVSSHAVVINDLHRHPLAYAGIRAICAVLPVPPMFAHDGPVSVLRAFRRHELVDMLADSGLINVRAQWRWAFRWVASGLTSPAENQNSRKSGARDQ